MDPDPKKTPKTKTKKAFLKTVLSYGLAASPKDWKFLIEVLN
jgi:hypothetical protein